MNIPMGLPSDLIDLLAEFADAKVEYLRVGGQALALHGRPRFTKHADLWLRDSPGNIERTRQALKRFGAPLSVVDAPESAAPLDVLWMGTRPGANRSDEGRAGWRL
jgi:hypothetical protein